MSLRAPRLLPREHGWIETSRGLERGHRLITYTMRPDREWITAEPVGPAMYVDANR